MIRITGKIEHNKRMQSGPAKLALLMRGVSSPCAKSWFLLRKGEFESGIQFIFTKNIENQIMSKGTVKWFNAAKGYGFITPEDGGKDLFVHHSEIQSGGEYATLNDGQKVEYEVGQGQKGPCANKVVPI